MSYEAWEKTVPAEIRDDPLWTLRIYRTALYAGELGHRDASYLASRDGCAEIAKQLARSTGAISARIAEGHSRGRRVERITCWESALAASGLGGEGGSVSPPSSHFRGNWWCARDGDDDVDA